MGDSTHPRWTIVELGEWVAEALSVDYRGPANGQVRAVPNQRSIRYYNTLGLLDRALEVRGRTAYYGLRHLMQLVAIKRLQSEGHSLEEIQGALAGLPDADLAEIARLPEEITKALSRGDRPPNPERQTRTDEDVSSAARPRASRRRQRFWTAEGTSPEVDSAPAARADSSPSGPARDAEAGDAASTARDPGSLVHEVTLQRLVRLALGARTGASLVFEPARRIDDDDVAAIRDALAPLVEVLVERGLLADGPTRTLERPGDVPGDLPGAVDDR